MRISETYASRNDLGRFGKMRFTLEERIGHNAHARAFYRWCLHLPRWAKHKLEVFWFILSAIPLMLAFVCEGFVRAVIPEECDTGGGVGFALFLVVLGIIPYFHWMGWVFIFMTFQFVACLWFGGIMQNYADELQRETAH